MFQFYLVSVVLDREISHDPSPCRLQFSIRGQSFIVLPPHQRQSFPALAVLALFSGAHSNVEIVVQIADCRLYHRSHIPDPHLSHFCMDMHRMPALCPIHYLGSTKHTIGCSAPHCVCLWSSCLAHAWLLKCILSFHENWRRHPLNRT